MCFCARRSGLRAKSLPLRGGWHPASPASRMTEEVIFVLLQHSSKETAIRYDTSSVACGDTFPSRGRTGWNSFRFCACRSGLRAKSLPSRGGWHPASPASRMTEEVIFVPLLHPSKESAIRYDTSSVACGDTFPSRGRTWGQTLPRAEKNNRAVRKNHRAVRKTTMPSEKWRLHFPRESYIIPRRFPAPPKAPAPESDPSGFSEVWYRAWFGTKRPWVQVPQPGPKIGRRLVRRPIFASSYLVAGLEKGGGTAAKNSPVDCFSARGKVPQPGQNPLKS